MGNPVEYIQHRLKAQRGPIYMMDVKLDEKIYSSSNIYLEKT